MSGKTSGKYSSHFQRVSLSPDEFKRLVRISRPGNPTRVERCGEFFRRAGDGLRSYWNNVQRGISAQTQPGAGCHKVGIAIALRLRRLGRSLINFRIPRNKP